MEKTKRYELTFEDSSIYSFNEESYDEVVEGTWVLPYPNTIEDSQVFGMLESWSQGEGVLSVLLWEKGEPVKVAISAI